MCTKSSREVLTEVIGVDVDDQLHVYRMVDRVMGRPGPEEERRDNVVVAVVPFLSLSYVSPSGSDTLFKDHRKDCQVKQ